MPHLYNDFVDKVAREFDRALSAIEAEYNFDLGDEFEIALCRTLRRILPQRFGICRGFVVSASGTTAGDDVIIYDRASFPTARFLGDELAQKEQVPFEAVAAYVEAKHTLELTGDGSSSLNRAIAQAGKVKALCNERPPVPTSQISRNVNLVGFQMQGPPLWPDRRNPAYCAIMARHVRVAPGSERITDACTGP